jgi:hypothetical protein
LKSAEPAERATADESTLIQVAFVIFAGNKNYENAAKRWAVARSAGSTFLNRLSLGLTPQALCFRVLRALSIQIDQEHKAKI